MATRTSLFSKTTSRKTRKRPAILDGYENMATKTGTIAMAAKTVPDKSHWIDGYENLEFDVISVKDAKTSKFWRIGTRPSLRKAGDFFALADQAIPLMATKRSACALGGCGIRKPTDKPLNGYENIEHLPFTGSFTSTRKRECVSQLWPAINSMATTTGTWNPAIWWLRK